ncbi:MAG: DUF397 domain-containing protein [Actinomycetota bacterium]|nr:DUF397 domain-containing protein [Actinomycetota bacterium]
MNPTNLRQLEWRKSSRSTSDGNCVEVAVADVVAVRDSKNTAGPTLTFPESTWSAFLSRR